MLDQNFAWKFEAFERFFDPEPGVIDHHCRGTTSGLLTIYIMMSQVQDTTISLLRPPMSTGHRPGHRDLHRTTEQLLAKMEDVRQQIQQVRNPHIFRYTIPLSFTHNLYGPFETKQFFSDSICVS